MYDDYRGARIRMLCYYLARHDGRDPEAPVPARFGQTSHEVPVWLEYQAEAVRILNALGDAS